MELFFQKFTDQNLTPIVNILDYAHMTKISRDDGLLSRLSTEVNGNDPLGKKVN